MNRKRLVTIAVVVIGGFLLIWVGLALTLRILYPPDRIERIVSTRLEQSLQRDVEIGSAGISIFPRIGFSLRDVSVANASGSTFSSEPMVRLEALNLRVALLRLFFGEVVISELALRKPRTLMEINENGTSNVENLGGTPDTTQEFSLPVPITLKRILVSNGTIVLRNRQTNSRISVDKISQRSSISIRSDPLVVALSGDTKFGRIEMGADGPSARSFPTVRMEHDLSVNLANESVSVDSVVVLLSKSFLGFSGEVLRTSEGQELDLKVKSIIYPEDLDDLLGQKAFKDGSLRMDAKVSGSPGHQMNISGGFVIDELQVSVPNTSEDMRIRGGGRFTGDRLVDSLFVDAPQSALTFSSTVSGLSSMFSDTTRSPAVDFLLSSPNLIVDEFLALVPTRKNGAQQEGDETDTVVGSRYPLLPVTLSGTMTIEHLQYRDIVMKSFEGTVQGNPDRVGVSLVGNYAQGAASGTVEATMAQDGRLSVSEDFNVRGAEIQKVALDLLDLAPQTSALVQALKNTDSLITGTGSFGATFSGVGRSFQAIIQSLDGTLRTTVGQGRLARGALTEKLISVVSDLTQQEFDLAFETMAMVVRIDTGTVEIDTSRIQSPAGLWIARGSAGLDGELDMVVRNRLPRRLSNNVVALQRKGEGAVRDLLGKDQEAQEDAQGRVTLVFEIGGFASDPSVRFAGFGDRGIRSHIEEKARDIQEDVEGRVEEQVEKGEDTIREEVEKQKERIREQLPSLP